MVRYYWRKKDFICKNVILKSTKEQSPIFGFHLATWIPCKLLYNAEAAFWQRAKYFELNHFNQLFRGWSSCLMLPMFPKRLGMGKIHYQGEGITLQLEILKFEWFEFKIFCIWMANAFISSTKGKIFEYTGWSMIAIDLLHILCDVFAIPNQHWILPGVIRQF